MSTANYVGWIRILTPIELVIGNKFTIEAVEEMRDDIHSIKEKKGDD